MFNIPDELKKLPQKPGVYIMKAEGGKIIYVGKAVNLHNRVRQYFRGTGGHSVQTRSMVPLIREFEYIVTDSELEALILENNLIKKHNPRYNVKLKDDKGYPYIKATVNEHFPRFLMARKHEKDKAKYFGPYHGGGAVRETLELLHRLWPVRVCTRKFPQDIGKGRPCLNYSIGKCAAPCAGMISEEAYDAIIDEAMQFLNGKYERVLNKLETEMLEAAENLEFEKAADLRDKIRTVNALSEKQKIDGDPGEDWDVTAIARANGEAMVQVFFIRGGKMLGREHFTLREVDGMPDGEVMSEFVKRFYGEAAFIPKEIISETEIEDREIITKWLSGLKGQNVTITLPRRGDKLRLAQMAATNAALTLEQFGEHIKREQERTEGAMLEIARALGLADGKFERVEAYDISNIQGFESVASMVVFENGKPKNSDYRKFKIKTVVGADDYASMEEVISRRFTRYRREADGTDAGDKFTKLPDIVFIDGGRGQVNAALAAMDALDIRLPVCGMVKDDRHRTRGLLFEGEEVLLPSNSEGFKLVTRIQDEVHRFAVEYHRKLRANAQVKSALDEIQGIGPARRKELMRKFKSIDAIKEADVETLAAVRGMNARAAKAVADFFAPGAP